MAVIAREKSWGLMNNSDVPYWIAIIVGVITLDLIIYLQHVMFHAVPVLWRIHMMHHADLDFDVTTGLRFHPIEIFLSMVIKLAAVIVLGAPAAAVIIFEILLNATAMFNHGNIRIYPGLDRFLRLSVVTPDMHRVHHSVIINETNSNFGFNLPWWDRIMGTYRSQPFHGHEKMNIGLSQIREFSSTVLIRMICLPFVGDPGAYSISHKGKEPQIQNK